MAESLKKRSSGDADNFRCLVIGEFIGSHFFPAPFDSEPCSWGCPPALVGTADWKKYSNTDYGISFDYPASWSPLRVDQATEQDLPMAMKYTILSFNKSLEINIDLSKYGNYKNPSYISDVQRLKEIFTTKKSRETDTLWLPPQPAAIVSHTPVQYIETPNGIFRGVYYFARINQNDDFAISDELHNLVVVLSDGKSTIFQVMVGNSGRSMKPGSAFQTLNQCNDIFHRTKCIIDKDFYSSFDTVYKQMLTNLHSL